MNIEVRRHPRQTGKDCGAYVRGQTFPVENWSLGGLLLCANEWQFMTGEHLNFTVTFDLRKNDCDLRIDHSGFVVRSSEGRVAICFSPLTEAIRDSFQQVLADHVAPEP